MNTRFCCSLLLAALFPFQAGAASAPALMPPAAIPSASSSILFPTRDFLFQSFPLTSQDEAFLAYRKARTGKTLTPELSQSLMAEMQGYPLASYIESWSYYDGISADPEDPVLAAEALEFLRAHSGEYVAERLGTDLARVAAKNGNMDFFRLLYEPLQWNKTEPDIAAWHLALEIEKGGGSVPEAVRLLRNTGKLMTPAFSSLTAAVLSRSPGLAWQVASFYIQHQYFQEARRLLKEYSGEDPSSIDAALSRPSDWIQGADSSADPKLFTAACLAAGYGNPAGCAAALDSSGVQLSPGDRNLIWNFLGYRTAVSSTVSTASQYFEKAGDGSSDPRLSQPDIVAGWRLKAALGTGNWKEVERAAEAMPLNSELKDGPVYWLGRAKTALGEKEEGKEILLGLSRSHTYYGKLACDALGLPYPGDGREHAFSESDVKQWMQNPSIIRAVLLRRLGLYSMASREWNWALRGASEKQLAAAADYARRIGLADRMINTAGKLPDQYFRSELSFPTPSEKLIAGIASETGVPEAWIYGITRQESRFVVSVASGAGARGLMQLLPSTARWTAKRYGVGDGNPDLSDPVTNMKLGAWYLHYLDERFGGQKALATAGYNAGPGRPASWRQRLLGPVEGAVFTELIPFSETRNYVKAVLANTAEYARILGKPVRLTDLLGTIAPPEQAAVKDPGSGS
ncbi:MAG: lytic transglycosylase domain-containing protein [Sutterellaceae bacterium]|nr:lytic transglycosylase domain-containing protein [Sutterellaceae bacterium]MDD7442419.1 transglycosylase SLT domain-containing protein [Sutterellaceae bacterium]MDY2868880.1 transglycosylase SLT domain-containing protein [Mesosutterella sp.]